MPDLDRMGDGTGRGLVHALATTQVWEPYFQVVRWRERHGEYSLEHDDEYVLAMVNALGGGLDASLVCDALREDDELRETTSWRIFEVPGSARVNLAYLDRYRGEPGQGWRTSIELLVADGTLDRDRVLDACAGAVRRDLLVVQRRWFERLRVSLTSGRGRTLPVDGTGAGGR
ncbi:hypothetical protein GC089_08490 [Cellulomonas sp. JZ18]|uniref:hypothetical protein n=1 Tax=Cellulomonas sp. JZ18 TaxID=2654191 RepID=UPI0012D4C0BF|nr:hypothetical protein [Cellulomonas sp. JZ18]QGQ19262.1 hypothetical protein GC089_08490 [Cellulomonas sp. JZ18]